MMHHFDGPLDMKRFKAFVGTIRKSALLHFITTVRNIYPAPTPVTAGELPPINFAHGALIKASEKLKVGKLASLICEFVAAGLRLHEGKLLSVPIRHEGSVDEPRWPPKIFPHSYQFIATVTLAELRVKAGQEVIVVEPKDEDEQYPDLPPLLEDELHLLMKEFHVPETFWAEATPDAIQELGRGFMTWKNALQKAGPAAVKKKKPKKKKGKKSGAAAAEKKKPKKKKGKKSGAAAAKKKKPNKKGKKPKKKKLKGLGSCKGSGYVSIEISHVRFCFCSWMGTNHENLVQGYTCIC